jgi:hypothetical protein
MSSKAKKEKGDRDRFIDYLKNTEGVTYVSVAENVKNRTALQDFDYLLKSDSGQTLALEITWFTDKDETHPDRSQHHDFLENEQKFQRLMQFLDSVISQEKLPGSLLIGVPFYVPLTRKELDHRIKNNSTSIRRQLAVIQNLSVGDCISITTDICDLQVKCTGKGDHFLLHNIGGHRGGGFDVDYFAAKVRNKIPHKNLQLDYAADRRVLFICNTIWMTFDTDLTKLVIEAAINGFIASSPRDVSNIDEIYVDYKIGEIERVYPATS